MKWLILLLVLVCPNTIKAQRFTYPVLPDSIRDRQGRICFIVENFWNEQTIADTTCFQSPKLLLDYLYLLRQTEETEHYAHSFISFACRQENTFGTILYWLDNILYDSSSPYYDEVLYTKLMQAVIASDADSVMKLIPRQRLVIMSKNQVGGRANNFSFIDKKGKERDLYSIEAPMLLLIFNNPDCSLCHRTEECMSQNEDMKALLNSGKLKVLAITPDADYSDWLQHTYPPDWQVGFDKDKTIYNQRLYDIQRLPCLYLLDKNKRVLLKEADYDKLCDYLLENKYVLE